MTRRHPAASLPSGNDMSDSEQSNPAIVTIWVLREQYAPEQKTEMIRRVSEAMAEVIGPGAAGPAWVVIEEIQRGDWWFGGRNAGIRPPATEQGGA